MPHKLTHILLGNGDDLTRGGETTTDSASCNVDSLADKRLFLVVEPDFRWLDNEDRDARVVL
jgi:hypothetical protein